MNCGIYEIASPSGKRYAGSASDFDRRRRRHLKDLRGGHHHSIKLQRAFAKYGEENLSFRLIVACAPDELLFYEQLLIDGLKPEYNVSKSVRSPMLGLRHSDETRAKMSKTRTGMKYAPEFGAAISKRMMGISRPKTLEQRTAMSVTIKAFCAANPGVRRGKKHSDAAKAKITAGLIGRAVSDETRKKISAAAVAEQAANPRIISKATGLKISAALKGRKRPPEVGAKIAASLKARGKKQ